MPMNKDDFCKLKGLLRNVSKKFRAIKNYVVKLFVPVPKNVLIFKELEQKYLVYGSFYHVNSYMKLPYSHFRHLPLGLDILSTMYLSDREVKMLNCCKTTKLSI